MENEKRLIDANALLEEIQFRRPVIDVETKIVADCVEIARKAIVNAPAVDAVEVAHGHWVSLTECANAGVYCSVCNKKVYKEDYAFCNRKNKLRSNYCPNCGAKMDGDGNG